MTKKNPLVALGVLLMAALALSASPAPAPAKARWKVVVPRVSTLPGLTLNLSGPAGRLEASYGGYVYDDAESAIEVYATIGMMSGGTYWTVFQTVVHYPEQVDIDGVVPFFYQTDDLAGLSSPGFPPGGTNGLFNFLNGTHPYDQRYTLYIGFSGPYVGSRAEADWENKPVGWEIPGRVMIIIQSDIFSAGDCNLCDLTNYHDIVIQSHDATLRKESATTYRLIMTATFDDPNRLMPEAPWMTLTAKDYILHRFCTCAPRVSKKTTYYVKDYRFPELAYAPMNLEMLYIKH